MLRRFLKARSAVFVVVPLAASLAAHGQTAPTSDYRIGPKDKIRIEVLEDEDLTAEARVSDTGMIDLPHVGVVEIGGMTQHGARDAIEQRLEQYLQRATVTVEILEYRARPIRVMGAVDKPGPLPFSGRWTLLEAIMEAGGPTATAGDRILITRRADNGLSDQLQISAKDLLERVDPTVDVPLLPNDLINLPPATKVTIYSMGEFYSKGEMVFLSTERVSILSLLARAGGLTDRAANTLVIRRARDGQELRVSTKALLGGRIEDVPLYDGDVVIAKESFF